MSDRRLDAMKAFEDVAAPPVDADAMAARRARLVGSGASTIRKEAVAREMRRNRTRVLGGVAMAASLVLAVGVTWRVAGSRGTTPGTTVGRLASVTGSVLVTHQGKAAPASTQVALAPEDEVTTTPDARARVVLASGANVEVAAGTRVRLGKLDPKSERVSLTAGEVVVNVPKLGPNESFRVETPDAEVTVHGTAFVVSFHEGATRVRVTEGVVSVKHAGTENLLRAGDQWPAPAPPASPAQASTETEAKAPSSPSAASATPAKGGARVEPSTLAEQNRLLQRALDARRRGDDASALEELGRLQDRYPRSPLVQEARVEKFRALERMGRHTKAVAEARRYLVDYPSGFAIEEARSLVLR